MSLLARWDPFKELDELHGRLSSVLGLPQGGGEGGSALLPKWAPVADISETENEYVIQAELPAVEKKDVKVSVEDGVLTLSGERQFDKEKDDRKYHRIERSYGSFIRSFTLPGDADDSKVVAEFKDGMLTIRLPKDEKAKPRTIEVKVG